MFHNSVIRQKHLISNIAELCQQVMQSMFICYKVMLIIRKSKVHMVLKSVNSRKVKVHKLVTSEGIESQTLYSAHCHICIGLSRYLGFILVD